MEKKEEKGSRFGILVKEERTKEGGKGYEWGR